MNPKFIFKELKTELIDEWQLVPEITCDEDEKKVF